MTAKTLSDTLARSNTLLDLLTPVLASPGQPGAILAAVDPEPEPAPDPRGAVWLAFTKDHNEDDAAAVFLRRYGQLPRYIFDGLGELLLVGPVPGLEGGGT